MTFLHPEFLYFMLPPLFILFTLLLTQKEAQENYFDPEVMQRLRVSANTLTMKARNALFMLIGFLIIIALGDPVIKEGKVDIQAKSADIMIALDISDSMLANDVYPNRLALAKQKALEFLKLSANERIGIIAFAKNSYLVSPLSFDHEAVAFLLSKLDTFSITEQGTDFLSMLEVVAKSIKNEQKKYVLLLSDGGDKDDFSEEIAYAKEHDIVLFIIGIGTTKGAPIRAENGEFIQQNGKIILTKLNEKIATLATETGGVYIKGVNSNADVKAMSREIENVVIKKELKAQEIEKYIPLFYYPVGLALLLLLIATSSMSKREKVELPSLFLLGFLLFGISDARAGLLDFVQIKDAKEAYEAGDYLKAAKAYESYAKQRENAEAHYDAANAYYKAKQYKKALQHYKKAIFSDTRKRAQKFANEGNTYAKIGDEASLKKAIAAYEESLKIQEDKAVRENMEAVKKALKKREKESKNNKNSDKKENKQQKKSNEQQKKQQQKENKAKSKQQKENKNSKGEKSQQKKAQQKQKNTQQNRDAKERNKSQKPTQEEQKEQKEQKEQQKQQHKKERKKESLKKLSKSQQGAGKNLQKQVHMSDAEEKKWLKALSKDQNTFLYMLNTPKQKKETSDEKPW
jgi:Ca-activated chloride channel family protein